MALFAVDYSITYPGMLEYWDMSIKMILNIIVLNF
jgi:hypothetical protein